MSSKPSKVLGESSNTIKNILSKPLKKTGPLANFITAGKSKTWHGSDRFIPSRSAMNIDYAQYKMLCENVNPNSDCTDGEQLRMLAQIVTGIDVDQRILQFKANKAPVFFEGFHNPNKILYNGSKTPTSRSITRYIPKAPERVLGAPDIIDDYFLNLVEWNSNNILAVALNNGVYLWYADSGSIHHLLELEASDYVCSVSWIQKGSLIAVGTSTGSVQLWDVIGSKRIRSMGVNCGRVCSLSWNTQIVSSGSTSGQIIHHDIRNRDHAAAKLSGHSHEVCGLKWSTDGCYLASGGIDNLLNIWSGIPGQSTFKTRPIYSLTAHQAAVKALAWCPWQPSILASGGSTGDHRIRFWNRGNGVCVQDVDTKSQVCSLLWSQAYKEIVSGHGFPNNQLVIWKYPSLAKVCELTGHHAKVLHIVLSSDGTTMLSASADEHLNIWRSFVKDKKKGTQSETIRTSMLESNIR